MAKLEDTGRPDIKIDKDGREYQETKFELGEVVVLKDIEFEVDKLFPEEKVICLRERGKAEELASQKFAREKAAAENKFKDKGHGGLGGTKKKKKKK